MPTPATVQSLQAGTVTRVVTPADLPALYAETDARFAVQTGITRKLDPKNPLDGKWIPVWVDLFGKVKRQFANGTIVWTHEHPGITGAISAASLAAGDAAAHLADMLTAPTAEGAKAAEANAKGAHAASLDASARAAMAQAQIAAAQGAAAGALRGGRHEGFGAMLQGAGGFISAELARLAARDVARGIASGEISVRDPADAVTALQSASAPSRADAVQTIASSATIAPSSSPASSATPAPHAAHAIPWAKIAIGTALLGGVAIAATQMKPSARHRRRQGARTVQLKIAR
jgi:hypothetical protein